MPDNSRYIMIGGFLGAGKSTALVQLGQALTDQGLSVGLITNDQSFGLVDTTMAKSRGFQVEEIAGGCFCCRFNSLVDASDKLSKTTRPDIFLAEPVGSCTDLVASVSYPLRRIYGEQFTIAPLSVMLDPVRAMRIFGLAEGRKFSSKVTYIYKKQLEEADIILINKIDLISKDELASLKAAITTEFPDATILTCSARSGEGLSPWIEMVTTQEIGNGKTMDLDYEVYADGEALLGWLNATIRVETEDDDLDGDALLMSLAKTLQADLNNADAEIAHLKMTLIRDADDGISEDVAVLSLVRNDYVPELSQTLDEPFGRGQLILNIRAEADPDTIQSIASKAVESLPESTQGLSLTVDHIEHFRPAKPEPTYRMPDAETLETV